MRKYCMKRMATLLPALFLISVVLFALIKIMPQDPVTMMMDPHTSPSVYAASYEAKKEELGLNDTLPIQYIKYMKHLIRGDFGYSSAYQAPVRDVIGTPLINTILLNFTVLLLSFAVSVFLGIRSACRPRGLCDRFVQVFSVFGISMPAFLLGVGLLYVCSLKLHIFPVGGMPAAPSLSSWFLHMLLPVITLSIVSVAGMVRYVRNVMREALQDEYILGLKSRGIPRKSILYKHVLRNALLPLISVVLLEIPNLISGSLIVEIIFSWNGIGAVMMKALTMRDAALLLTMNLLYALLYVISSFLMDLLSACLDPRIRLEDHV